MGDRPLLWWSQGSNFAGAGRCRPISQAKLETDVQLLYFAMGTGCPGGGEGPLGATVKAGTCMRTCLRAALISTVAAASKYSYNMSYIYM